MRTTTKLLSLEFQVRCSVGVRLPISFASANFCASASSLCGSTPCRKACCERSYRCHLRQGCRRRRSIEPKSGDWLPLKTHGVYLIRTDVSFDSIDGSNTRSLLWCLFRPHNGLCMGGPVDPAEAWARRSAPPSGSDDLAAIHQLPTWNHQPQKHSPLSLQAALQSCRLHVVVAESGAVAAAAAAKSRRRPSTQSSTVAAAPTPTSGMSDARR